MNSPYDPLHEELERLRHHTRAARQNERPTTSDPETKALAALARSLREAPALQVDPHFADHLEQRLLARQAALQRQRPAHRWWAGILPHPWRAHPALSLALSLVLVVALLSTGLLVAAAQVTSPNNPLYALKHWEQQVQGTLTDPSTDQAEQEIQTARSQLNTLPGLANAAHAGQYRHALAGFDQQLRQAEEAVDALPAGPDRQRLLGELTTLQTDARSTLRGLLLQLAVPERQATTDELGRLGDIVPHLTHADVTLPAHPNGLASVSISGDHVQAGAALLVDGQPVTAAGSFQNGRYLFTLLWKGSQHPHSIGIMNPDGTVAQTTAITLHMPSGSNGSGGGNGNGGGNGSSNEGGKPESTPTPHSAMTRR